MLNTQPKRSRKILFVAVNFFILVCLAQGQTVHDVTIERDGIKLKGKFYLAGDEGKFSTVILLPGFPGNERDVLGIGEKLSQAGINALTFNYAGTYQSQGLVSFENNQKDIQAAFDFINNPENISKFKIDESLTYLGGWCHGGGMALVYAAVHPEVTTVFSIAGNDFGEFLREYARNDEMKKMIDQMFLNLTAPKGPARFETGALPHEMVKDGVIKIDSIFDIKKNAASLAEKDILLIGGWNDVQTTIELIVLPIYRALQNENANRVKMLAFQDDHYFKNTREELAKTLIDWIKTAPGRK